MWHHYTSMQDNQELASMEINRPWVAKHYAPWLPHRTDGKLSVSAVCKRFYAIGYLSAIVGGVLVFLYIKFFERDELMGLNREVKTTGVGFQMYTDPNMYGNEARLFLGKGYWLPEYMFTSGNVTKLEKFVCMEDDIVVASFPKSGNFCEPFIYHNEPQA